MSRKLPDIDIDVSHKFDQKHFNNIVRASRTQNKQLLPHPSGYYFENIPVDELTNLAAIPFKEANDLEYFKIDFLHAKIYDLFDDRQDIFELIKMEPDWELLKSVENISKISQIHDHPNVVLSVNPKSINDLADVLALIRPAKKHLLTPYALGNIDREQLYSKPTGKAYYYKKSHAIAYAHIIVIEMHLLKAEQELFSDA